jgi:hypothetical protein
MTAQELYDHALRLQDLLGAKRHLVRETKMGLEYRAHLLLQIDALNNRVDQLLWESANLASRHEVPTALDLTGERPRVDPLPEVVA